MLVCIYLLGVSGGSGKPTPSFGGLDGVLKYMEENCTNESGLIEGLAGLYEITLKQGIYFMSMLTTEHIIDLSMLTSGYIVHCTSEHAHSIQHPTGSL